MTRSPTATLKRCLSLFLLIALLPEYVRTEETPEDGFHTDFSLRLRGESLDWYRPPASVGTAAADKTDTYFHSKALAGVKYTDSVFKAGLQFQYFQLSGLKQGALGPGGTYFSTNGESSPGDVAIRQAYLTLNAGKDLPVGITAGRFLYANGGEVQSPNKDLQLLKQRRLSNRVLGTFEFTGGRSFDGALLRIPYQDDMFTVSYFRPTQGGFATDAMAEIKEIQITTAAYTGPLPFEHPNEFQLFHYYFEDARDGTVVKTDNRPLTVRAEDMLAIRIHNFGFSSLHVGRSGPVALDGLFWGILQGGAWGEQSHHAGAFALEAGTRLIDVPWAPRLGAGFNWGKGDANPQDGTHTTFFQMLPTARQYAMVPFYNSMNNEDLFVELGLRPSAAIEISATAHLLTLESAADLLYAGGGANKSRDQFGFAGTALSGSGQIGVLTEIESTYRIFPEWTLSVFYGHLEGGKSFDAFDDQTIDYGFIETSFRFSR